MTFYNNIIIIFIDMTFSYKLWQLIPNIYVNTYYTEPLIVKKAKIFNIDVLIVMF